MASNCQTAATFWKSVLYNQQLLLQLLRYFRIDNTIKINVNLPLLKWQFSVNAPVLTGKQLRCNIDGNQGVEREFYDVDWLLCDSAYCILLFREFDVFSFQTKVVLMKTC